MTDAFAKVYAKASRRAARRPLRLVCAVDGLPGLRAAVDAGADCVQLEYPAPSSVEACFKAGADLLKGVHYAQARGTEFFLAIAGTFVPAGGWAHVRELIDTAARAGIDALDSDDASLLLYAASRYPWLALHYSPRQALLDPRAAEAARRTLGVSWLSLPRSVSLARIEPLSKNPLLDLRVHAYGETCAILRPRQYACGMPDAQTAALRIFEHASGSETVIAAASNGEEAANDIGSGSVADSVANMLDLLPHLAALKIRAITISAAGMAPRQVGKVIGVYREAINECLDRPRYYTVKKRWVEQLIMLAGASGRT